MNRRILYIDVLKAIACLLIINSHCSDLYPNSLMAFGGGQGNAIFLMVTGFLCADVQLPWKEWITKRYFRLMPITLIICVLDLVICVMQDGLPANIITYCLDRYWFVWALAIYYIPYFMVFRSGKNNAFQLACLLYCIGYAFLYLCLLSMDKVSLFVEKEGFAFFKVYFYFAPMLMGGIIAHFAHRETGRIFETEVRCILERPEILVLGALVGLSVWGFEYICTILNKSALKLQFLINLGNLIFCVCLFCAMRAGFSRNNVEKLGRSRSVKILSTCTLEIYLVQILIKSFFLSFDFPINAFLYFMLSIGLGVMLHYAFNRIPIRAKKLLD